MSHAERTACGQGRSRANRRLFRFMTLGLGVPWLFYRNLVWAFAARDNEALKRPNAMRVRSEVVGYSHDQA